MAVTKTGVVYGALSGLPRRFIYPDDDALLQDPAWFRPPGEAMLLHPVEAPHDWHTVYAACCAAAKVAPSTAQFPGRCIVIDAAGAVVNAVEADPLIDTIHGHALVQHDQVNIGWTYAAGTFTPPPGPKTTQFSATPIQDAPIPAAPAHQQAIAIALPILAVIAEPL